MIRLEAVSKTFPNGARASVDAVTLEVPTGETCVLIGPSGCGKTTTLRMINRLIEPSAGRIFVGDEEVTRADPVILRRHIGYVIQGIGLFPHMSVGDNVATVPKLLGWKPDRTRERVAEMLSLVGLPPGEFMRRRPGSLSGGQRQRVGVARALAADPPVMLMDEPFGAVDPVVRARLQREFGDILRRLKKTVVMVTHDIDEAIRMGDRIAVMRDGRLIQYDTPDRLLGAPVDAFVSDFVGSDRTLKRLSLLRAADVMIAGSAPLGLPRIDGSASLQSALSAMLGSAASAIAVTDASGALRGFVTLERIRAIAAADHPVSAASTASERATSAS